MNICCAPSVEPNFSGKDTGAESHPLTVSMQAECSALGLVVPDFLERPLTREKVRGIVLRLLDQEANLIPLRMAVVALVHLEPRNIYHIVEQIALPLLRMSLCPSQGRATALGLSLEELAKNLPRLLVLLEEEKSVEPVKKKPLAFLVSEALPQDYEHISERLFVQEAQRLLHRLEKDIDILTHCLLPIIRAVLCRDGTIAGLTYLDAIEKMSELRFLLDVAPEYVKGVVSVISKMEPEISQSMWLYNTLPRCSARVLQEFASVQIRMKAACFDLGSLGLYPDMMETLLPLETAKSLLSPENDGTVNVGLIKKIKQALLKAKTSRNQTEKEICRCLRQLSEDRALCSSIEALKEPHSEIGKKIVRSILHLRREDPLTAYHARLACLATCLTRVRQEGGSHNGAMGVFLAIEKDISLQGVISDFHNFLVYGGLKRNIKGSQILLRSASHVSSKAALNFLPLTSLSRLVRSQFFEEVCGYLEIGTFKAMEMIVKAAKMVAKDGYFRFVDVWAYLRKEGISETVIQNAHMILESFSRNIFFEFCCATIVNASRPSFSTPSGSWGLVVRAMWSALRECAHDAGLFKLYKVIDEMAAGFNNSEEVGKDHRFPLRWICPYFVSSIHGEEESGWVLHREYPDGPQEIQDFQALGEVMADIFSELGIEVYGDLSSMHAELLAVSQRPSDAKKNLLRSEDIRSSKFFADSFLRFFSPFCLQGQTWVKQRPVRFPFFGLSDTEQASYFSGALQEERISIASSHGLRSLLEWINSFQVAYGAQEWLSALVGKNDLYIRIRTTNPHLEFLLKDIEAAVTDIERKTRALFSRKVTCFPSIIAFSTSLARCAHYPGQEMSEFLFGMVESSEVPLFRWLGTQFSSLEWLLKRPLTLEEHRMLFGDLVKIILTDIPEEAASLLIPFAEVENGKGGPSAFSIIFNPLCDRYEVIETKGASSYVCRTSAFENMIFFRPRELLDKKINYRRTAGLLWKVEKKLNKDRRQQIEFTPGVPS